MLLEQDLKKKIKYSTENLIAIHAMEKKKLAELMSG